MDPTALLIGQTDRQTPASLLGEGDYDGNEENTSELADVGGEYDFSAENLPKSGELEASETSSGPEEPDTISFRVEPDRQRGVPSTGSGRKSPKTAEEDVKRPENAHKPAGNTPEMTDEATFPGMGPMSVEMVPEDPYLEENLDWMRERDDTAPKTAHDVADQTTIEPEGLSEAVTAQLQGFASLGGADQITIEPEDLSEGAEEATIEPEGLSEGAVNAELEGVVPLGEADQTTIEPEDLSGGAGKATIEPEGLSEGAVNAELEGVVPLGEADQTTIEPEDLSGGAGKATIGPESLSEGAVNAELEGVVPLGEAEEATIPAGEPPMPDGLAQLESDRPVEVNEQARMPDARLAGAVETARLGEPESLGAPDVGGEPFGLVEEDLLEPAKPVDWPSVLGDTVASTGVSDQGQAEQPAGEPTRDVASSASRNEGRPANIIKMSEPPEGDGTPDVVAPPSMDAGDRELDEVGRRISKLENYLRWKEESEGMA